MWAWLESEGLGAEPRPEVLCLHGWGRGLNRNSNVYSVAGGA